MKTFTTWDYHTLQHARMWFIKRPDAYAPRDPSELPKDGETVLIDDKEVVVKKADFSGDSEFKFYPHIVILADLEP